MFICVDNPCSHCTNNSLGMPPDQDAYFDQVSLRPAFWGKSYEGIFDVFKYVVFDSVKTGFSQPPSTPLKPARWGPSSGKGCARAVSNFCQDIGSNGKFSDG